MARTLLALALALLPNQAQAQKATKADLARNGWYADYGAARKEARRTGKPILLVFRCDP